MSTESTTPTSVPTALNSDLVERWSDFYRHAHAHPELSMAEFATTDAIEAALTGLGVEHFRVSETGTVAVVRNGEGPVVAFRADIDGLPVTEQTGLDYASTVTAEYAGAPTGVMHACGHDAHFSALLGALDHLLARRDTWSGTLVLVFQPAEEMGAGATAMVAGGLWEKAPRPDVVLGQHVSPMPADMIATRSENILSLSDTMWVTVHGKQAHGSMPQDSVDPVVAAAAIVTKLQTVVARGVAPGAGVVVTVGTINGGTAPNIIPETCEFSINIRNPDAEVREGVIAHVQRILAAEEVASGARVEVTSHESFGRCYNDPEQTAALLTVLGAEFGEAGVMVLPAAATGSEDVGGLSDPIGVPLVYWFFGSLPPEAFADGMPAVNHSPLFAPDAVGAMRTGIRAAVAAITHYLGH